MKTFSVTNPTGEGFKCKEALISVYGLDGKPFYIKENKPSNDGRNIDEIHFNLPMGEFQTANILREAPFRRYNLPRLHTPEKTDVVLKTPVISFGFNPNKASVDIKTGNIFIDEKFFNDLGIAERVSFLYHEAGHNFYFTEEFCDDFSTYHMLKRGFNPSQTHFAGRNCLSKSDKPYKNSLSPLDRQKRIFRNSKNAFQ